MIIRRATRPRQFAIVDMALMNDEDLTAEALGVLLYLLAKPDNWRVSIDQLKGRFCIGRDKMQGIMRLLRDCGYARLEQMKDPETGRLLGQGYSIHDESNRPKRAVAAAADVVPDESEGATTCDREPENPALGEDATENRILRLPENPTAGKPGSILNTDSVPNTESNLSPQPPETGGREGVNLWDEFAKGWDWDDLDIPDQARRAFERLDAVDQRSAARFAGRFCALARERERKIPTARNWLNSRGWENVAKKESAQAATSQVRIWVGSPQAAAWAKHEGRRLYMTELKFPGGGYKLGTYRPSEWPPRSASATKTATAAAGSPAAEAPA